LIPRTTPVKKMLTWRIANSEIERQNLGDSLRAALIRTAFSDAKLSTLPEGCSFTLTIEVREETDRPGGNVPPPVPLSQCFQLEFQDEGD
jgi:mitotic spindle assembly checkpoint protein MAD2B